MKPYEALRAIVSSSESEGIKGDEVRTAWFF